MGKLIVIGLLVLNFVGSANSQVWTEEEVQAFLKMPDLEEFKATVKEGPTQTELEMEEIRAQIEELRTQVEMQTYENSTDLANW